MGDNDLVEQSGERVEDADVDSVAEQQQDVAPIFKQPAQSANEFTRAFVFTVVAATGLGCAGWSRWLCLENYAKTHHDLKWLPRRQKVDFLLYNYINLNSLTHKQKYEEDGGEDGDAVEHDGQIISDVFEFIVISHQQWRQKESCCHSKLKQTFCHMF